MGGNRSSSLNSIRGVIWGILKGTTLWLIKEDTKSLDNWLFGDSPVRYGLYQD